MFLCFHVKFDMKAQNMHVFMYFLHLVPPSTPPLHHNGKGSIKDGKQKFKVGSRRDRRERVTGTGMGAGTGAGDGDGDGE